MVYVFSDADAAVRTFARSSPKDSFTSRSARRLPKAFETSDRLLRSGHNGVRDGRDGEGREETADLKRAESRR